MKRIVFSILVIVAVGFSTNHYTSDKATATVNQQGGIYIFTDSKPVSEYEFVQTIKCEGMTTGTKIGEATTAACLCSLDYTQQIEFALNRIKKKKIQGDGIIYNAATKSVDVIKFK